jgi:hypothetical protein
MGQSVERRGRRRRSKAIDANAERDIKQFMCTEFRCWIDCSNAACRRAQRCVADSLACFGRYWDSRPHIHAWVIAARRARKSGLSTAEAMRTADREARAGAAAANLPWIADYLGSLKAETQPQSSANKSGTRLGRRRDGP